MRGGGLNSGVWGRGKEAWENVMGTYGMGMYGRRPDGERVRRKGDARVNAGQRQGACRRPADLAEGGQEDAHGCGRRAEHVEAVRPPAAHPLLCGGQARSQSPPAPPRTSRDARSGAVPRSPPPSVCSDRSRLESPVSRPTDGRSGRRRGRRRRLWSPPHGARDRGGGYLAGRRGGRASPR